MFHIDSSLVESFIVLIEVLIDFYIFNFLFKVLTIYVSISHRQFYFLFYTDFLPPNMNNLDPIKVDECPEIPSSSLCCFM